MPRKKTLEHLKKSEKFYRILFEHSGTAIAVNNKEGIITSVNKTFCDLSGYSKNQIEGKKHYLEFVFDKERVKKIHEKRWKKDGESPTKYEYTFLTRNNEKRLIDITINRIPKTDVSIASMIDNTEKKNLEREMHEKDQFLANILQESADAIIVIDNDRIIKTWNKGAELIFGYKAGEIFGKNFSVLVPKDLMDQNELEKLRENVLEFGYVRNYITERIRKDLRRVTVAETATLIKDEHNIPIGRAVILRDITERIRFEQQITQNEKMLAIGTLSASLAHEIKNPLNSMVINLEILKNQINKHVRSEETKGFDKYLDIMQKEIHRLDKVMKDFLCFAKPQTAKFKPINFNTVIEEVIGFIEPQITQAKVLLIKRLEPSLYDIHGEENQLKQIVLNLLLNSMQAAREGDSITIETKNLSDGKISVVIKDTGTGIKEEYAPMIFDLFFTTKEHGSGLGLPTVFQLVKNHGGTINFESKEGVGTTFSLSFLAT